MKKFFYFICIALAFVGAIGGFGFAAYNGDWFVAACVVVLACFASFKVVELIKTILA